MDDDSMDLELQAAGERWRAANADAPRTGAVADFDVVMAGSSRRALRSGRWLVAASVAVLVAAVAAGTTYIATRDGDSSARTVAGNHGPAPQGSVAQLTGSTWVLVHASEDVNPELGPSAQYGPSTEITLKLDPDGTIVAEDGVNTLSGSVEITDSTLSFGTISWTAVGSTDPEANQLALLIGDVLHGTIPWNLSGTDDSTLTLSAPGIGTLVYQSALAAKPTGDPATMPGTWNLVEVDHVDGTGDNNSGSGSASGSGTSDGFGDLLVIDADSTFKVQHRCYADSGDVAIGSGTATWSNVKLAGAIPCPSIPDQQDEQTRNALVDSVLTGATTWIIGGDGELRITKGGDTIVYAPYASGNGTTPSGSASS